MNETMPIQTKACTDQLSCRDKREKSGHCSSISSDSRVFKSFTIPLEYQAIKTMAISTVCIQNVNVIKL